jgi:phosphomannomutase
MGCAGLHIKIRPVTSRKQHISSIIEKLKELKKEALKKEARVVVAFDGQCILHAAAVENGEQMLANDYTGYVFLFFSTNFVRL